MQTTTGTAPRAVWGALTASWNIFHARPWSAMVLALAILASMPAVCLGFGVALAAWFGCELFALQLRVATGERVPRTSAWVHAAVMLTGGVGLLSAVGWLVALGLGAEMPVLEGVPRLVDDDVAPVLVLAGASLLALHFILPFSYAPFWLVWRGGTPMAALQAGVNVVAAQGHGRAYALSVVSHGIQGAPIVAAAAVASLMGNRAHIPWAVALVSPLLLASIPLGQGMFVAQVVATKGEGAGGPEPLSRPETALALALALVPVIALVFVAASLLRPSQAGTVAAPMAGELVATAEADPAVLHVLDTALVVRLDGGRVTVETLDGGGVGSLGVRGIRRVRVLRVRDAYAVEMAGGRGPLRVVWVDWAGVRLDDNLSARLLDHMPIDGLAAFLAYVCITPFGFLRWLGRPRGQGGGAGSFARTPRWVLGLVPLGVAAILAGFRCLW